MLVRAMEIIEIVERMLLYMGEIVVIVERLDRIRLEHGKDISRKEEHMMEIMEEVVIIVMLIIIVILTILTIITITVVLIEMFVAQKDNQNNQYIPLQTISIQNP